MIILNISHILNQLFIKYPFLSQTLLFLQYSLLFPDQQTSEGPIFLLRHEKIIPILEICASSITKSFPFKINNSYYWKSEVHICNSDMSAIVIFKIESSKITIIHSNLAEKTTFLDLAMIEVIKNSDKENNIKVKQDIRTIESALKLYKLDNYIYPTTDQTLEALVTKNNIPPEPWKWKQGGYLDNIPIDPWGGTYNYLSPGVYGEFDIYSFGADGKPD